MLLTKYYWGLHIEKNEVGGACSTYEVRGEVHTGFSWGNVRESDHLEEPSLGGRIILKWIFRNWEGVVGTGWSWLRIRTGGGCL